MFSNYFLKIVPLSDNVEIYGTVGQTTHENVLHAPRLSDS